MKNSDDKTSGTAGNGASLTGSFNAQAKNLAQRAAHLYFTYPGRISAALWMPSSLLLAFSALSPLNFPILLSGLGLAIADLVLMRWADPKTGTSHNGGTDDPQNWPFWRRLVSPRRCPWEFAGLMCVTGASPLMIWSALSSGLPHEAGMAAGYTLGSAFLFVREKKADAPNLADGPAGNFLPLARPLLKALDRGQRNPQVMATIFYLAYSGSVIVGGITTKQPSLTASGVWSAVTTLGLLLTKKRLQPPASPETGP